MTEEQKREGDSMTTDQDIIDRAAQAIIRRYSSFCPISAHGIALALADAGLLADLREELLDEREEWHESWKRMRQERDEARAALDRVRKVADELDHPSPEADQDWCDDPVGCIRDALRRALRRRGPVLTTNRDIINELAPRREMRNLIRAIQQIQSERDAALATIERVRALHKQFGQQRGESFCEECEGTDFSEPWPCPTVKVLDGKGPYP